MYKTLSAIALVFASIIGANAASPPAYTALSVTWANDWNAQNLEAVMQLYAPDPVFHTASGERWSGASDIRQHFTSALAQFRADLHMHSVRTETSGNLGYDSGTYEETLTSTKNAALAMRTHGSYLFVYQRQANGAWKIREQVWTGLDPVKL